MAAASTETQACPGTWLVSHAAIDGLLLRVETGAPPCAAQTPSGDVIFDGALYNRKELAERLDAPAAGSDAALLLKAYARWGEDLLHKIKGIFALILWDRDRQTLLAARDPMGVYPLYYSDTGRELVLSTSVDALLQHPSVSRAVNRAALADHLLHRWPDFHETFYEKVMRVPPGYAIRLDEHGRRSYRYWDPAPPGQPIDWIREEELHKFDVLFAQAVRRCLAFGPAGIFLSGGLDSVTVAAVASQESRRMNLPAPLAMCLDFPNPEDSEEAVQRSVAGELGLPLEIIPLQQAVGPEGLLISALRLSGESSMPLLNSWYPAYLRLGLQAGRRGCRTVLTGTGGDEWLGVSPLLSADLMRALDVRGLCRLWSAYARSYRLSRLRLSRNLLWRYGLRPLLRDAVLRAPGGRLLRELLRALRRRTSQVLPDWVAPDSRLRKELGRRAAGANEPAEVNSHYLREMRLYFDHLLPCWEVEECFENARRMGLRILHPFEDADLADFLYRTPPQLLYRDGRSKGLVRQFLARRFPRLGFERQKKVFSTFFNSTLLEEGRAACDWMGGTPALVHAGIVDGRKVGVVIDDILVNKTMPQAFRIWDVLNAEAWLRPRL
jgi:asparagine synthase (glutamine-hydrolysing)